MKRVVIFASGSGTNAENLIKFFHNRENASVIQVLTNNPRAKVLERAKNLKVSALSFNKIAFTETDDVLNILKSSKPDLIVLAGFLWKFPKHILEAFPNKVINIHPAYYPNLEVKACMACTFTTLLSQTRKPKQVSPSIMSTNIMMMVP